MSSVSKVLFVFICIAWIWITSYLLDQVSFITMSCAAQYYFSSNSKQEGMANVMQSMYMSNFTHAGSVAMGAGIHTILVVFNILNEVLQKAA